MAATKPRPVVETVREKRWTYKEYERLGELGVFKPGDHVQLIEGVIYESSPQRERHAGCIRKAAHALRRAFGLDYVIEAQLPLVLGQRSGPEPDLSVLPGPLDRYVAAHPRSALLLVEVSDTTLLFDRSVKAELYARHDIPEYWICNLRDNQLEVRRDPGPEGYQTTFVLKPGDTISPVARPDANIAVADLLP